MTELSLRDASPIASAEQELELRRWRNEDFDFELSDYTAPYSSSTRLVVIGACGRSGTTVLRRMLGACPQIIDGPESYVFLPKTIDMACLERRFGLPPSILNRVDKSNRWQFADEFQAILCRHREGSIWVDKTSRNVHCFEHIRRAFPQAMLIHMVRDPRDVVASLRTHPQVRRWDGPLMRTGWVQPWTECIERWCRAVRDVKRCAERFPIHEVRYEDLIVDPLETLRSITGSLGVRCPDRAVRLDERRPHPEEWRFFPNNHKALLPLSGDSVGRWKGELPPSVVSAIEEDAGGWMTTYGYG